MLREWGHANMRITIADLKLANAESKRMRLRFVFEMEQIRKEQDLLKTCQQEGVALLQQLVQRICGVAEN